MGIASYVLGIMGLMALDMGPVASWACVLIGGGLGIAHLVLKKQSKKGFAIAGIVVAVCLSLGCFAIGKDDSSSNRGSHVESSEEVEAVEKMELVSAYYVPVFDIIAIEVKNMTDKTITAFKGDFFLNDQFGDPKLTQGFVFSGTTLGAGVTQIFYKTNLGNRYAESKELFASDFDMTVEKLTVLPAGQIEFDLEQVVYEDGSTEDYREDSFGSAMENMLEAELNVMDSMGAFD